jgi:subtilisin family serine protease
VAQSKPTQYVILPPTGLVATAGGPAGFLRSLHTSFATKGAKRFTVDAASGRKPSIKVVDSIRANGPQLVECSANDVAALRAAQPGIRVVPVVYFRPAVARMEIEEKTVTAQAATRLTIKVVAAASGKAVAGATVVAFTDFEGRRGAQGVTNASGKVALALGAAKKKIERLYIYPEVGLWPMLFSNITLTDGQTVPLTDIDNSFEDCVRFFYGPSQLTMGTGVKVGVLDTGIALNHPNLVVDGGQNTVQGEDPNDFGDNGESGHGTHCAGIIASRNTPLGIAPGVTLRSYRVFGKNQEGASNFAIAKAIDAGVTDGCDVLNMSLGGGDPDTLTEEAIASARAAGTLIFAANGNDGRQPVSFPAAHNFCQAVSAMGRKGTFPSDSEPSGSVAAPFGTDTKNFIADFSNIGDDTDFTGPGVGVISTVPKGFGVMSGTSMACPAEVGAAARLLGARADILSMPRSAERWAAMVTAVAEAAKKLGFGPTFEGQGMIK